MSLQSSSVFGEGKPAPSQWVTNVTLENITGTLHDFGKVDGPKKSNVSNLTFKNINIALTNPAVVIKKVTNLKLTNVKINGVAYTGEQQYGTGAHTTAMIAWSTLGVVTLP